MSSSTRICKCPTCQKKHKKKVFYTGRAKHPPYQCNNCKDRTSALSDEEYGISNTSIQDGTTDSIDNMLEDDEL